MKIGDIRKLGIAKGILKSSSKEVDDVFPLIKRILKELNVSYEDVCCNEINEGIPGPQGPQGEPGLNGVGWHGSFFDTTNQTGVANSVLTMSMNNSDSWNNGVSLVSGTRITLANPGVYNLAFSAQMLKTGGNSSTHAHIWLAQNGTAVPTSASQISFPSNSVYTVAAWNFFFETTSVNEYVELKWEINSNLDNQLFIKSELATGTIPAISGLIVTINQVG